MRATAYLVRVVGSAEILRTFSRPSAAREWIRKSRIAYDYAEGVLIQRTSDMLVDDDGKWRENA